MSSIRRNPGDILIDRVQQGENGGGNAQVTVQDGKIHVKAPEGISFVTLRWEMAFEPRNRIFGDAFERGYGTLEWRCILPERVMPWYCAAFDGETCQGFGVKVRPNALCYWQIDPRGINLTMDLRCGAAPALLAKVSEPQFPSAEIGVLWRS